MKAMSIVLFVLLLASLSQAQQRWERHYGGVNSDKGNSVQQTSDGGYIIAGYTNSFGATGDVYLVKTNASGDTLWTRTYGGGNEDFGYSVQQTSDTGYIIAGCTLSFGVVGYDVYLIKTNASGDTLWMRTYGGSNYDFGYSVQQTTDGGYIVAGTYDYLGTNPQVYLIKTNASGDTLWTRTYGGANDDWGYSVQQTSDGGFIIAGYTTSFGAGGADVYLIKTNASGDTIWTRTYGGSQYDEGKSVHQTSDGGYIVAGYTFSFGAGGDFYLVKTNASGDTLWTRTFGGTQHDEGNSVQQTSDEGYIIVGIYNYYTGHDQVYLVKTNASGDTLWSRIYGGTNGAYGYSVKQTYDRGYIIAGETWSLGPDDVYLIKTDSLGRSTGVEESAEVRGQKLEVRITAIPNPFTSFATLPGHEAERFSLYDVSGRKVGTFRGDRVGEGLAPGVYFLRPELGSLKPLRIVKLR